MKSRWLAKQNKLQDGRNELDDELHEKNTALANLTEELQEMEEYAYLPLIDEIEIDSINYAMDTIEKLSARIYEKTVWLRPCQRFSAESQVESAESF